jgi:hypothetical protein
MNYNEEKKTANSNHSAIFFHAGNYLIITKMEHYKRLHDCHCKAEMISRFMRSLYDYYV